MKIYIITVLILLPMAFLSAAVTVVSQSADELLLEFNLPEYQIEHLSRNGTTWQHIVSDYGAVHAQEGYPELRVYSEAIGIPVDGDISIQVTNIGSTLLKNINLSPVEKMVLNNDGVDYIFYQNTKAYRSPQLYPAVLVEKGESAFMGNRNFIPLQIFPFQYRAATKELVVNTKFTIRVMIQGSKAASSNWQLSDNPLDQVAEDFFLNNASSVSWRLPKTKDNSFESPKDGTSLVNEIQLIVNQEGIYKITYAQLDDFIALMTDSLNVEMAWDLNTVDPRNLELRDENGSVPINFQGESDGDFDQADFFEFYGDRHYGDEGYSDDYTDDNVYTLSLKNGLGARMAVENGGLVVSNAAQYIVPDAFEETVHFEEQLVSDKLGNNWTREDPDFFREDTWFWRKINAPDLDIIPFELQYPKDSTIRTASVKAVLYGLTYAEDIGPSQFDHEASVRINEAMINTHSWRGQTEQIFLNQNPVANSYFRHGTNYLYISLSGNTVSGDREQVLLDYMELKYWREYKTDDDHIKFTKPSNRPAGLYQFQVEGFSNSQISVYKKGSSVFNSCQIEPFNTDGMAPWTITLQDSVASTAVQYYAVTENQKMIPKEFRLNIPSDLKNPLNQANVILVSRGDFLVSDGTGLLVSTWEDSGHIVALVDYQDIFDEFNNGIRSAESLKEFFKYAYNNWGEPQLSHIVLLGEGVEDERDNSPAKQYTIVPVKRTWTYTHGSTASDGWYACLVGDDLVPDISVSRINAWKADQIAGFADKAYAYRNNLSTSRLWNSHVTLCSGGKTTDTDDIFAQQSERIRRINMPQDYRATRVYTATQTVSDEYLGGTFDLKDAINSGTQYLHFLGHGGGRTWSDYNLFNFNDIVTLNNQTYPIVLSLCCYASSFDTNGIASISEALVMQPNKGAIATAGFTALGYMHQDEEWGLAFTEAIFKHDFATLGEAYQYAVARFYTTTSLPEARYALTNAAALLGDALIKPLKPITEIPTTVEEYTLEPGDTLLVSASFPADVTAARLFIMNSYEKTVNIPYDLPVINGIYNASYVIPAEATDPYQSTVYIGGYSASNEYVGRSVFSVGRPAIVHNSTLPSNPAWSDSVGFICNIYSNEEILAVVCRVQTQGVSDQSPWQSLLMQAYPEIENAYITIDKIPLQTTGEEIACKYVVTTSSGSYESPTSFYVTQGPELILEDLSIESTNTGQNLKVLVTNVGNSLSATTDLKLYTRPVGGAQTLFSTQDILPLAVNQERWETIALEGLGNGNLVFEVRVNSSNAFSEWQYDVNTTNIITLTATFNYFAVGNAGAIIHSVDNNLDCEIPVGLVQTGQNSIFYINSLGSLTPNNQPDISEIKLRDFDTIATATPSNAYEIRTMDPALVDSTDTLINNKKLKLSFYYSVTDTPTQDLEPENSYKIYRWDVNGSKWILQGGNISSVDNTVVFEVDRQGTYTIFRNRDRIRPSIDINVQDQEFTVGGYISGTGTISLLLSDANGIDVFDNTIRLYLNGFEISPTDYVASINLDNVNRIPIKYQLALDKGNYTLVVDCKDVNGNFNTRDIQFIVNETFDVKNVGNYPNPVLGRAIDPKNDGRTRFTYVLTDDADEVTIKIYTVSGRLVQTFDNLSTGVGYHEYPRTVYGWDCKDTFGFTLANGVYFYKIIASRGNKRIEKTMKMAILK